LSLSSLSSSKQILNKVLKYGYRRNTIALIDLQKVSKHYSAQKILTEIDFHVDEGERIVIIGKNGSGKSTLMKVVNGTLDLDGGRRITKNDLEVKMLDQRPEFEDGHTVRQAVEAGLKELNAAKERYNELSILLSKDFENKILLDEHETLSRYIEHHKAWNLDDKIERIIQHFDLKRYEEKPIALLEVNNAVLLLPLYCYKNQIFYSLMSRPTTLMFIWLNFLRSFF